MIVLSEVDQLRAKVAELEEELAAWRANDRADVLSERQQARMARLRELFGLEHGGALLLDRMLQTPGRLVSNDALCLALRPRAVCEDLTHANMKVRLCRLRRKLEAWGFCQTIKTLWGQGYLIVAKDAGLIEALVEGL